MTLVIQGKRSWRAHEMERWEQSAFTSTPDPAANAAEALRREQLRLMAEHDAILKALRQGKASLRVDGKRSPDSLRLQAIQERLTDIRSALGQH